MGRWARLHRLSWSQHWTLLQAMVLLPATALGVHLVGFRGAQSALSRLLPAKSDSNGTPAHDGETSSVHDLARIVRIASQYGPYRANCLPTSLSLWWLLGRRGIASALRLGVRKESGQLEAHAWIELQGVPVNESHDPAPTVCSV